MKTFKKHLNQKLQDPKFKEIYNEEKRLLDLAYKIHEYRDTYGLSQKELAKKAHVTQQQLSKIENGINCNIKTFLRVCLALGLHIELEKDELATV